MNNQEFIQDLMDFLYGEMEEGRRAEFRQQLEADPQKFQEWQDLQQVRTMLQNNRSPGPAPMPSPAYSAKKSVLTSWLLNPWIQAAIIAMVLMSSAALSGFYLQWQKNTGLQMGFGGAPPMSVVQPTTESPMTKALSHQWETQWEALVVQQDSLNHRIQGYHQQAGKQFSSLESQLQNLARSQEVSLSDTQFNAIRKELMRENYQLMTDLMEYAVEYQRSYSEQVLQDFAQYLNTQRTQDLHMISIALQEILQQNDVQQQETEMLLSQLITHIQSD